MRILVVEDDPEAAEYVTKNLKVHGHVVQHVRDGRAALLAAMADDFDLMIVDRMVPHLDGLSLVRTIRQTGIHVPVLFLTALNGIDDRVQGLEAGADDYLVKPFAFSELLARINALARRPPLAAHTTVLRVADLEMDLVRHTVRRGNREVMLQPREYRLLEYLMRNAGRVVTRTMLLENVWDFNFEPRTKIIETQISRLRSKVDQDDEHKLIDTVRGSGYVIRPPA
jgi:two-component system, OmpR family, response regulator